MRKSHRNTLADKSEKKTQRLSAKGKALSYLSRREHSIIELRAKLLRAGYDEVDVDEAVTWVERNHYQSNERFSNSLIRRRAQNYGDRAIQAELALHQIEVTVREVEDPEAKSEHQRALEWLLKRQSAAYRAICEGELVGDDLIKAQFKFKSKCFRALSHRGFEFRNIESAWKSFVCEFSSDRC